jgi:hypothetical protein
MMLLGEITFAEESITVDRTAKVLGSLRDSFEVKTTNNNLEVGECQKLNRIGTY